MYDVACSGRLMEVIMKTASIACCLALLVLAAARPVYSDATPEELEKFTPWGYWVVGQVDRDLNHDGQTDVVFALERDNGIFRFWRKPPKVIALIRTEGGLTKAWEFSDPQTDVIGRFGGNAAKEPVFQVQDINGDGYIEILFSMCEEDRVPIIRTYGFAYRDGQVVSIFDQPLDHDQSGGVQVYDRDPKRPGREITVYSFVSGQERSGADPPHYRAECLAWDPKLRKYQVYQQITAKKGGRDGFEELGILSPSM